MADRTRFDPVGRLASICLAVLLGAVALTVAVDLLRSIWPWLFGIALVIACSVLLIRIVALWRRQRW